MMTSMELQLLF